jgi:hypothetical protein
VPNQKIALVQAALAADMSQSDLPSTTMQPKFGKAKGDS